MSKAKRREWLDVTRLDFRHTYRSPLVEILIVLFLYFSFNAVSNWMNWTLFFTVGVGIDPTEIFLPYVNIFTTFTVAQALEQLWAMLIFIVPLLVAFTTAKSFEDNSFRTILSYPVKRWQLLIMRTIVPTVIIGTCVTFSVLLAVFLMIPAPWNLGACVLLFGVFWLALLMIITSTVFLAVITKRMIVSALGGVAVWFSLMSSSYSIATPEILRWIGNPMIFISRYVYGESFDGILPIISSTVPTTEIVLSFVALLSVLIVLFLSLSVWLFKRMEV
jgi:hypothetical protein